MSDDRESEEAWSAVLRRVIELSAEERNLRTVVRRVAEFVVETTRAHACFVHLIDHATGELVLTGATPDEFDALAGTIRLHLGEGVAGWVAEQGRAATVNDKWADPRYLYIPALRGEEFASMLSVPMRRPKGVVIGVLNVHSHQPRHFADGDEARLTEVASLLAGIVENAVLYDQVATREHELERFAARTIELQELDRRRIAADIHDGISQRLVSAYYHVGAARSLEPPADVLVELDATGALLSDALEEARRAIVGLRPAILDDLGLGAGLASLTTSLGTDVDVVVDVDECALPSHVETALYRMAQEAVQNVAKHSRASSVEITLRSSADAVRLTVIDDGVGFDPAAPSSRVSFGLSGLAERAALIGARLELRSRPGDGTEVTVRVSTTGRTDDISGGAGRATAPATPPVTPEGEAAAPDRP